MFKKKLKSISKKRQAPEEKPKDSNAQEPKEQKSKDPKTKDQKPKDQVDSGNSSTSTIPPAKKDFVKAIKDATHNPADLVIKSVSEKLTLIYIDDLVDDRILNQNILPDLFKYAQESPSTLNSFLTIPKVDLTENIDETIQSLLNGSVLIHVDGYAQVVLGNIATKKSRSLSAPENESQVIGSQVGFNESLSTNVSLVRRYIMTPDLCKENFKLGKRTNTTIALLYIKGVASEEMTETLRQRIKNIDIDAILDSSFLAEIIDDNSISIFPQMLLTERPDRFCDGLLNGKIGIIVDGSSMAIICPQAFIEFFQSREDQNLRWPIATFVRLLRFSAVFLSIFFTPMYVAALTFHYEVIPQSLVVPLSESRALVPFPPIIEAFLLEFIIELLREAGARLPTKVGQTIGIVGGIVIGTAAVQAGITSNILIIIVALSALASFTMPSYMMGNVIRIIRFPLIILAGFWGFYGIMLGFCLLLIHLLRQSSLGSPYTSPFYPPRLVDWSNSLIRLPLPFTNKRPTNARPEDVQKFEAEPVNPEKKMN